MNKNITISVEEYKELLLKERPSDNDKWLLGKIKEYIISNCKVGEDKIEPKDSWHFGENFISFIKLIDTNFYKEIIKNAYDIKIEEEENKLKMEKLRALKEANKEVKE
jgi:hypothetical protein